MSCNNSGSALFLFLSLYLMPGNMNGDCYKHSQRDNQERVNQLLEIFEEKIGIVLVLLDWKGFLLGLIQIRYIALLHWVRYIALDSFHQLWSTIIMINCCKSIQFNATDLIWHFCKSLFDAGPLIYLLFYDVYYFV